MKKIKYVYYIMLCCVISPSAFAAFGERMQLFHREQVEGRNNYGDSILLQVNQSVYTSSSPSEYTLFISSSYGVKELCNVYQHYTVASLNPPIIWLVSDEPFPIPLPSVGHVTMIVDPLSGSPIISDILLSDDEPFPIPMPSSAAARARIHGRMEFDAISGLPINSKVLALRYRHLLPVNSPRYKVGIKAKFFVAEIIRSLFHKESDAMDLLHFQIMRVQQEVADNTSEQYIEKVDGICSEY